MAYSQYIFVVRHANRLDEVDTSWRSRAAKPYDTPISSDGEILAEQIAYIVSQTAIFSAIYCSPFTRCMQTAKPIAKRLGCPNIVLHRGLGELQNEICHIYSQPKLPDYQEIPYISIIDNEPMNVPETISECHQRYIRTIISLANENPYKNIVIVTHGGAINAIDGGGGYTKMGYCAYRILGRRNNKLEIIKKYIGYIP